MALTNPNKVVTEERLNEYHQKILPYLGGNSMVACGGGYAPIGTVIAYMGTSAPSDFLICDGTVYNISDYTELADFFEAQFGSSNFFGGDGNTTFAVPDLRGEFLRGTGTNSHANQGSGANVGVHQDGTKYHHVQGWTSGNFYSYSDSAQYDEGEYDSVLSRCTSYAHLNGTVDQATSNPVSYYTSRPTNTSVLYCIKAKSQGNGYSLDEQIVGTWIDGKPIYQKTWVTQTPSVANTVTTIVTDSTVKNVHEIKGNIGNRFPLNFTNGSDIVFQTYMDGNTQNIVQVVTSQFLQTPCTVTLLYTKNTD